MKVRTICGLAFVVVLALVPALRAEERTLGPLDLSKLNYRNYAISPDSLHYAHHEGGDVFIDGEKVLSYSKVSPTSLVWSRNGKTLAFWGQDENVWKLIRYDLTSRTTKAVLGEKMLTYLERGNADGGSETMMVSAGSTLSSKTPQVRAGSVVSPDGSRAALAIFDGSTWKVIMDDRSVAGSRPGGWDELYRYIAFSPDGARVAFKAQQAMKWYVVVGKEESGPWDVTRFPSFSENGKHYVFQAFAGQQAFLVVDGEKHAIPGEAIGESAVSNDGRLALWSARTDGKSWLYRFLRSTPSPAPAVTAVSKQPTKKQAVQPDPTPASVQSVRVSESGYDSITSIAIHPSGRYAWTARDGKKMGPQQPEQFVKNVV